MEPLTQEIFESQHSALEGNQDTSGTGGEAKEPEVMTETEEEETHEAEEVEDLSREDLPGEENPEEEENAEDSQLDSLYGVGKRKRKPKKTFVIEENPEPRRSRGTKKNYAELAGEESTVRRRKPKKSKELSDSFHNDAVAREDSKERVLDAALGDTQIAPFDTLVSTSDGAEAEPVTTSRKKKKLSAHQVRSTLPSFAPVDSIVRVEPVIKKRRSVGPLTSKKKLREEAAAAAAAAAASASASVATGSTDMVQSRLSSTSTSPPVAVPKFKRPRESRPKPTKATPIIIEQVIPHISPAQVYHEPPYYEMVCDLNNKTDLPDLLGLIKSFVSCCHNPKPGVVRDEYLASLLSKSGSFSYDQVRIILSLIAYSKRNIMADENMLASWVSRDINLPEVIGRFSQPDWWLETPSVSPIETSAFTLWATLELLKFGGPVPGQSDNATLMARWIAMDPQTRQQCVALAMEEQRLKDAFVMARRA